MNRFVSILFLLASFDVDAGPIAEYFQRNTSPSNLKFKINAEANEFELFAGNASSQEGIPIVSEDDFQELIECALNCAVPLITLNFGTLDDRYLTHLGAFLRALPGHPESHGLFKLELKRLHDPESTSRLLHQLKDVPKLGSIGCLDINWDDTVSFQLIAALKENDFNALQALEFRHCSLNHNVSKERLFVVQKAIENLGRNIHIEAEGFDFPGNSFMWFFHKTAFQDAFKEGLLWSIEQFGQKWKSVIIPGDPLYSPLIDSIKELAPQIRIVNHQRS